MLRALALIILLPINLVIWGSLVFFVAALKFVTFGEARRRVILIAARLGELWGMGNDHIFNIFLSTRWEIEGLDELRCDGRYLIISNHVTWVDIFALFRAFRGRAPLIRFFLKRILIWFPVAGQACWALEFPFMRRYTPEYLERHPEKRGADLRTTRIACQRYRTIPVTILNFAEGTRFTREKQEDQRSPYMHLLRPRVGGVSFVIASLGDQLDAMYDVTLVYPDDDPTLLQFVTNRLPWVKLHARRVPIPEEFKTAAITEPGPARDRFKHWMEGIWREKDATIQRLRAASV